MFTSPKRASHAPVLPVIDSRVVDEASDSEASEFGPYAVDFDFDDIRYIGADVPIEDIYAWHHEGDHIMSNNIGIEHAHSEVGGWNAFDVSVRADKSWVTDEDREASLCRQLARHLRQSPTLPAHFVNPHKAWMDVQSGVKFPAIHCAFKRCLWSRSCCNYSRLLDHLARQHSQAFRDVFGEVSNG